MWFVNYQKIAMYREKSDMGRSLGQKCILKDDSLELVYPSEAHTTAGRRPALARSERSERSVREALLQKIDLF